MFIQPLYGKHPLIEVLKNGGDNNNELFKVNFNPTLKSKGESASFYFCKTSFQKHTCYGLIAQVSGSYPNKKLFGHEECFPNKIAEFYTKFQQSNLQLSPVLLFHQDDSDWDDFLKSSIKNTVPDFVAYSSKCTYEIWKVDLERSISLFYNGISKLYIADGHHRISSLFMCKKNVLAYIVQAKYLKNYPILREYNLFYNDLIKSILKKIKGKYQTHSVEFKKIFSEQYNNPILSIGDENFMIADIDDNRDNLHAFLETISPMNTLNSSDVCFTNYLINKENSKNFIKLSTEERKSRIFLYIPQINIEKHIENRNIMLPPHSSWFEPKIPPGVISMEINGY
jgi:uncharacterized protein (DUF1015 family)